MAQKNEEALKSVSESAENFTTDFHKSLAGKTSGNFVGSALSAHTVLAMAAYGADGNTAQEMRKTLHLPADDSHAHQGFQNFIDTFNNVPKVDLQIANKIYAAYDLAIKEAFKEITGTYFRSESEVVDFKKNVESANLINNWCNENTKGKIKEILKADDINESVRMVLLNAVYFKGNWKHQFNAEFTEPRPFHVDKNTTIDVPTMYIEKKFYYFELPKVDARAISLPYENEDLYMVIIVPNEIDGLEKIEKNLDKINIKYDDLKRGYKEEVHLYLPKFKIESTHDLESHLSELGMVEMFSQDANFKKLCDEKVYVSKVIQKAMIEVNEEGSTAAAVTGIRLQKRCLPPPPIDLQVDRPFLFKIVDIERNITFFSGRINQPKTS